MFHVPEFYPDISLKFSRVLEQIGVNERIIHKRRRTWLLGETLFNISHRLEGKNVSRNYFGSKSEGTTTPGLYSDTDTLMCLHKFNVIQDLGEWEPGLCNLLMIQEETTPPGYCMLQLLYSNVPTVFTEISGEHQVRYRGDKVLLKNTFINSLSQTGHVKNGPARTSTPEGYYQTGHVKKNGPARTSTQEGYYDQDLVPAFPMKTLPEFLSTWLQQQKLKGKLSQDMKRYIESNPCYVVAVGRTNSLFEEAEYRISTSHAERRLMLNFNITQLQCYIMLKLLLKTHLKHPQEKALSSFMCKNILLLCIGNTCPSEWCPQNLLSVFECVLFQLKRSILQEQCPHFIIHENNLMGHKFTPEVKSWLLDKIQFIYETHGRAFLDIEIDDIGDRLRTQLYNLRHCIVVRDSLLDQGELIYGGLFHSMAGDLSYKHKFPPEVISWLKQIHGLQKKDFHVEIDDIDVHTQHNNLRHCIMVRDILHRDDAEYISGELFHNLAMEVSYQHLILLQSLLSGKNSFNGIISTLVQLNHHGSFLEQAASRLLTPLICSSLGSAIASRDIYNNHSVSPEAHTWLSLGLNSDVASSRLKLASVYYCIGDIYATETILTNTAEMYDQGLVKAVCTCYGWGRFLLSARFHNYCNTHNELSIRHCVAYCVRFTREEVHCQPPELQYEMFRSTQEERAHRDEYKNDCWMDWAVVDSIPYLYFLQYKTYGRLQRYDEQQQALNNLDRSIHTTDNLMHIETALNLLGQCYRQENRHTEALHCYMDSLHTRPTNNSARLHICLLLYAIYRNSQSMQ